MELIGPHEGKEFDLIRKGQKDVALFYELIPQEYFEFKRLDQYGVIEFEKPVAMDDIAGSVLYVILYRRGFQDEAEELRNLVESKTKGFNLTSERRIGEILGYPEEAIEHYLHSL